MKQAETHYPSLLGFIVFGAAALLLVALGSFLGLSALLGYLTAGSIPLPSVIYAVVLLFLGGLIGLPSIISLLRFQNKPAAEAIVSTSFPGRKVASGVIGAGLALLIGILVQDNNSLNWLILPLVTIPAVMLPIWAITGVGMRDLSLGSRWRTAAVFGTSLTVTPFVLFMLEAMLVLAIVLILVIYTVFNPGVLAEFEKLSGQLMFIDLESEQALRLILPYLLQPIVLIPVGILFSLIIPLVEELVKPLAVWVLGRKLESAAQGFALGALSGAGFAIIETFNVSAQTEEWGVLLSTRIGTGLLRITTSAIMGAAIYLALRERRYLNLLGSYLLAVLLHGLWNASALTVSFSALAFTYNPTERQFPLEMAATIGLVVLAMILIMLLVSLNRKFKRMMPAPLSTETPTSQDNPDTEMVR